MRFIKDNLLLFTLFVIVGVATLDSKNVIAGGDPNVKDSKVTKSKSNIKQHDHNKTYVDKQNELPSTDKKRDSSDVSKSKNNIDSNK